MATIEIQSDSKTSMYRGKNPASIVRRVFGRNAEIFENDINYKGIYTVLIRYRDRTYKSCGTVTDITDFSKLNIGPTDHNTDAFKLFIQKWYENNGGAI